MMKFNTDPIKTLTYGFRSISIGVTLEQDDFFVLFERFKVLFLLHRQERNEFIYCKLRAFDALKA